jgi:hypothetical protein
LCAHNIEEKPSTDPPALSGRVFCFLVEVHTWRQWTRDMPWPLMVVLALGFFVALVFHRRCGRQRVPLVAGMVLWILPVVLIQGVAAYERVWLFALPLFCIVASAGITLAVMPLLERLRVRRAMVFVAVAASLLLGLRVQRNRSVLLSNEGRGMEDIALYLQGRLHAGDSVVVELPSDGPLFYYFNKLGVPASYLNAPTEHRVLVVVNEVSGDTVAKVIEMARKLHTDSIRTDLDAGSARLLVRYDSACLYEVVAAHAKT